MPETDDATGEAVVPGSSSQRLRIVGDVRHLVALAAPIEEAANRAGIFNVFADGGYPDLIMLTMFGLHRVPGRLGHDAVGPNNEIYELKTVNLVDTKGFAKALWPGVTTEHTLTLANLERYRKAHSWLIGVFRGNQPLVVYEVPTSSLEPYFAKWESVVRARNAPLNNPKIPMGYVIEKGIRHEIPGITADAELPRTPRYRLLE